MSYRRTFELERGEIDLDSGSFPATLFTDGEASDGHILSIDGATVPERMPLFVNHEADPTTQLGSLIEPKRTTHAIKQRGVIELQGEGVVGDIRRDVALMISRGHVTRMSGRWDASDEDVVARTSLPKDHFAHVGEREKGPKRYGEFFQRWTAIEGSIVGLGADPKAVIGRASDVALPEHVRTFWRSFASEQTGSQDGTASIAAALSSLRLARADAVNAGATEADLFNALEIEDVDHMGAYEHEGSTLLLPKALIERLRATAPASQVASKPAKAAPTPVPVTAPRFDVGLDREVIESVVNEFRTQVRAELQQEVRDLLRNKLGVVLR